MCRSACRPWKDALARFGKPEILNTDQGSQFASTAFTGALMAAGIKISRDGCGRWMDNDGGLARRHDRRARRQSCGYDACPVDKLGQRWRVAHISTAAIPATGSCSITIQENRTVELPTKKPAPVVPTEGSTSHRTLTKNGGRRASLIAPNQASATSRPVWRRDAQMFGC